MAQEEKWGTRDRTYSEWHRRMSTQRFVGIELAQTLAMIDLDAALFVEYDDSTKEPLCLIETARYRGHTHKVATVTQKLAKRTNPIVPAYVLLYETGNERNPAAPDHFDIVSFYYRRIWPTPEANFKKVTPQEWAEGLCTLRGWAAKRVDLMINEERVPLTPTNGKPLDDESYWGPQS